MVADIPEATNALTFADSGLAIADLGAVGAVEPQLDVQVRAVRGAHGRDLHRSRALTERRRSPCRCGW